MRFEILDSRCTRVNSGRCTHFRRLSPPTHLRRRHTRIREDLRCSASRVTLHSSMSPQPQVPCLQPPFRCKTHWKTQSVWAINTLKFTEVTPNLVSTNQCCRPKA